VTIQDALGVYPVTFTIKAKGGLTTTVSFEFEIECGFDIRENPVIPAFDPALNPITLYYKTNSLGEYTLSPYMFTGGHCVIWNYVIDNDSDRKTNYLPIQGVDGIKSST
jgi:hypothetical protein